MTIPSFSFRRGSLGLRIIAPAIVLIVLLVAVLAWSQLVQLRESRRDTLDAYSKLVGRMVFGQLREAMQANDPQRVQAQIGKLAELGPIRSIQVVANDGRIVFASDRRDVGRTVSFDSPSCRACHGSGQAVSTREHSLSISSAPPTVRSVQSIVAEPECRRCHARAAVAPIATLFTDLDEVALTGGAEAKASRVVWLTSAIAALLLAVLLVSVRRLVVARVFGLRKLMDHIRSGVRSNLVVSGRPRDEIDDLARSLQAFTLDLDEQVAIQRATSAFSGVLSRHAAPVWLTDVRGRILLVNRHAAERFGFQRYSDYAGRNRSSFAESPGKLVETARAVGWALSSAVQKEPCVVALSDTRGEIIAFMEVWPDNSGGETTVNGGSEAVTAKEPRVVLPSVADTDWAVFVTTLLEQVRPGTRPWRGLAGFDRNLARARSLSTEIGRTAVGLRQVTEVHLQGLLVLAALDAQNERKAWPRIHSFVDPDAFIMGTRYQLRALFSLLIQAAAEQAGGKGHLVLFTQPGYDAETIFVGAWANKPGASPVFELAERFGLARAVARAHGGAVEVDPNFNINSVAETRGMRVAGTSDGSLFVAKISVFGHDHLRT